MLFVARAMEQPMFGWAGWGRFFAVDEKGEAIGVPDGLWIILLGQGGIVALGLFSLVMLLPPLLWIKRCPARLWTHPAAAPAAALAVVLALHMIDNLMNAMIN